MAWSILLLGIGLAAQAVAGIFYGCAIRALRADLARLRAGKE
jgi:hypothetical protein